jgi:hypothetical protein
LLLQAESFILFDPSWFGRQTNALPAMQEHRAPAAIAMRACHLFLQLIRPMWHHNDIGNALQRDIYCAQRQTCGLRLAQRYVINQNRLDLSRPAAP